jgi:carotenoid cleavage dioxygenase-like enzyme
VNVNVGNFLSRQWAVVDANGEVRSGKMSSEYLLHISNPFHHCPTLVRIQFTQPSNAAPWDDQGMPGSPREYIKKGKPLFTF